jgi:hypothetical protein
MGSRVLPKEQITDIPLLNKYELFVFYVNSKTEALKIIISRAKTRNNYYRKKS